MKIKAVCDRTELSDRAIRLYIDSGLLAPDKTENYAGRRSFDFSEDDVVRLDRIAALRASGFSIAQIREILQNPDCIPSVVSEVTESKEEEQGRGARVLDLLHSLDGEIASFDELADRLRGGEVKTPPAEDSRLRLRCLFARFSEGAYRSGMIDGMVRTVLLIALALFGCTVNLDKAAAAGICVDLLSAAIAAAIAVVSALILIRDKDAVNGVMKLLMSNLIVAAAIGGMFLVWLAARIIFYPVRPIPDDETVRIAGLWIGFILVSAFIRIPVIYTLYKKREKDLL